MRKFKLSNLGTFALISPFHVLMVSPGSTKDTTYIYLPHREEPILIDAAPEDFEDWLALFWPHARDDDDEEGDDDPAAGMLRGLDPYGLSKKPSDDGFRGPGETSGGTTDMAARGRPGEDLKATPGSAAATDPRTPGPEQRLGDQLTKTTEPATESAIHNKPGDKPGDMVPAGQVTQKPGDTKLSDAFKKTSEVPGAQTSKR